MEHIRPPPELDFSSADGNLPEKWRRWKQTMTLYLDIAMHDREEKDKCSAFLYLIGQDGREIYNTFNFTEAEKDKVDPLFEKFTTYCAPRENITVWRHRFHTRTQGKTETIDQYLTELRTITKNCKFGTLEEEMLRDRIVCGVVSEKVKERLLRDNELTLQRAVTTCRANEESQLQLKTLHGEEVCSVKRDKGHYTQKHKVEPTRNYNGKNQGSSTSKPQRRNHGKQSYRQRGDNPNKDSENTSNPCGKCGTLHRKGNCPAFGKTCLKCKRLHHFAQQCRTKSVHNINEFDSDETFFIGAVNSSHKSEQSKEEPYSYVNIGKSKVRFKMDTGSQVNIISESVLRKTGIKYNMDNTSVVLTSYSGDNIPVIGKCVLSCSGKPLDFYVIKSNQTPLLGFQACQDLGLIQVVMETQKGIDPIQEFPYVFKGLGCLQEPYKISIDHTVQPVVNPPRKIPASLREKLKITLGEMERDDVIRKVDHPTDWVNSIVVVEKPKTSKLRICLDPRNLNKAIRREHYQLPTVEEITTRMSGAKVFSKLDANHGYWQVALDNDSQLLTTFNTPFGRYCYQRMPFGIKCAQEVFQKRLAQSFEGFDGVETDIDDILVWGKTKSEHDERLRSVLRKCEEINLTLNKDKCEFSTNKVKYIGHVIAENGISPDPDKVEAITKMPAPTDKKGVERLLGTINYLAKFIPNMSKVTQPIRSLLRKDVVFEWSKQQDEAFKDLKQILSQEPVLKFFDVKKPVTVSVDASKSGLGAVVMQDNRPIAYASRALTDTERRYAQIEKELLAVTFGLERFNQYTYGVEVTVEFDHKPLESIVKKPLAQAPPRLQRMLLRLQRYTFVLTYKPGKELYIADTLSRAYLPTTGKTNTDDMELESYVHTVMKTLPISDDNLSKVRTHTEACKCLTAVKHCIQNGWPDNKKFLPENVQKFWKIRNELTIAEGVVLKNERLVIPESLQGELLEMLHIGHFGTEKTKQRARSAVYWPGINTDITNMISKCSTCMELRNSNAKEPLIPSPTPQGPWQVVATDLFTLENSDYIVVTDYYSRFFEVAKLESMKSSTVILHLKSIFARHGIPYEVRSDNGPQYSSKEFKALATEWHFKHVTSSPHFPQANGLAEKTVQTIKRLLQKASRDKKDPYLSLLEYRNTPIDNASPAQLLMSRELRSILPVCKAKLNPRIVNSEEFVKRRNVAKMKQHNFYNAPSKPLKSLDIGQQVRFKLAGQWKPGWVTDQAQCRSYNIQTPSGDTFRRNRKHIIPSKEASFHNLPQYSAENDSDDVLNKVVDTSANDDIPDFPPAKNIKLESESESKTNCGTPFKPTTRSGRIIHRPKKFEDYV